MIVNTSMTSSKTSKILVCLTCKIYMVGIFRLNQRATGGKQRYTLKFCKFHGKTPVLESIFNKVAQMINEFLHYGNVVVIRSKHRCFPVTFVKLFKSTYFEEDLQMNGSVTSSNFSTNCTRTLSFFSKLSSFLITDYHFCLLNIHSLPLRLQCFFLSF